MTWALRLPLTQVFDGTKHVLCNGFLVLDNLLNDDCLWEAFFGSLRLDGLGRSVEESLLAIAEGVLEDVTASVSDLRVRPVVVSCPLLAGAVVSVCFLVHLGSFSFFFETASHGVQDFLSRHLLDDFCGHSEGVISLATRPVLVAALVGLS